jgi:hypothetical protein
MGTDGESPHRICKPEVTGSIPVRSIFFWRAFFGRLFDVMVAAVRSGDGELPANAWILTVR